MGLELIVAVDEIPEAGWFVDGSLPAEWLGDTLLDAYTALGPVHVQLSARRLHSSVYVEGTVSVDLSFECSRTLVPGQTVLSVALSELFQPEGAMELKLGDGLDADAIDDTPWTYDSSKRIDLEPLIREELVLAQEPFPTVEPAAASEGPVWTSTSEDVDPRWSKLKDIKLG